jgi:hypothetical protein
VHLVMSGVFDDEDSFTFAQWRDCQTGQPGDGRLVSGAVADDQRTAVVRQCLDDPLERRAEQPTFVLDKIRINSPHVFERGSFAGLAASRHLSSTADRSAISVMIGASS